jgi:hypothetical protein
LHLLRIALETVSNLVIYLTHLFHISLLEHYARQVLIYSSFQTVTASRAFRVAAPTIWNNLRDFVEVTDSFNVFKRRSNVIGSTRLFKQSPFFQPASLSRGLTSSELRRLKPIKLYCTVYNIRVIKFLLSRF